MKKWTSSKPKEKINKALLLRSQANSTILLKSKVTHTISMTTDKNWIKVKIKTNLAVLTKNQVKQDPKTHMLVTNQDSRKLKHLKLVLMTFAQVTFTMKKEEWETKK